MADRVIGGDPAPGETDLRITRTYPVRQAYRLYTVDLDDNGDPIPETKEYLDLTGYTGTSQVRQTPSSVLLLELDVEVADPQSGDDLGKVTVSADAEDTTELAPVAAEWDLRLVDPDGVPRRWLKGSAPIVDPVTEEVGS